MGLASGTSVNLAHIGWGGVALLAIAVFLGWMAGSYRSDARKARELIDDLQRRKTIENLNKVAGELRSLVEGENKRTLDQINRLFGRLVILDRTGTAVALLLAGLGVTAGILGSATSSWIERGTGAFDFAVLGRAAGVAAMLALAVLLIFFAFKALYELWRRDSQEIHSPDKKDVRAAIRLIKQTAEQQTIDDSSPTSS
jgi:hypothetical protein